MANYYCSTSGNDGNAGTILLPVRSPVALRNKLSAGDTGYFKRGDTWLYSTFGNNMRPVFPDAPNESGRITIAHSRAGNE